MPLIEAAVLANVIMIGDVLRVGRRFRDKPLAVTTIYRTVVSSFFVSLFFLLEHLEYIVEAMIRGGSPAEGVAAIANQGLDEILGSCVMIFAAFLPFFALEEIERAFGAEKERGMFFSRRGDKDDSSVQDAHT